MPGGPGAMDLAAQYMSGLNPSLLGHLPQPSGAAHLLTGPMVRAPLLCWPSEILLCPLSARAG